MPCFAPGDHTHDCRASCHETLAPKRPASHMAPCSAGVDTTTGQGRTRGDRPMSPNLANALSSGCRTTRRQRSARLRSCAWRHGDQRYALRTRFMAIHSAALDAQLPAQTDPTPARSILQQVTWTGHRISASPRGTPATGSVLPLFGPEDTRKRPSTRRRRRFFGVREEEPLGHKGRALSVPAFSRRPSCGRMPGLRQAWAASPALPSPLCTAILRAVHRAARPLVGLDGEERRIGRKKRGRRPSRLLILPTGNDQVFTNPSSQLSKAW